VARARLLAIVYGDLKGIAASMLQNERAGHTLQPTALVHEAWLRLIDQEPTHLHNKTQFLTIAAQAMRRVLIDHARRRSARVEGGRRAELVDDVVSGATPPEEVDLAWIVDLDEALRKLAGPHPRKAKIVELRFFGGLSLDEVAEALGLSAPTVDRDWAFARAWLKTQLGGHSA
jgi:RNA polymerase sigma-70 factor, ECF subfamily